MRKRGNRRQRVFFSASDYRPYCALVAEAATPANVEIWACCLMPNHVHIAAVPGDTTSLARLFGEAHRKYTRRINFREGWRGHFWQERFHSFVMAEQHLLAAVRYVELNPVSAGLRERAEEWIWSSARAHLDKRDDALVTVAPMLRRVASWSDYLSGGDGSASRDWFRQCSKTGRPAGSEVFIGELERRTGRSLEKGRPGPKIQKDK